MGTRITVTLKGSLGDAGLLAGVARERCLVSAMTGPRFRRRPTPCGLP